MHEVISIAGAGDMDKSDFELSDMDDFKFLREELFREVEAVFRPAIITPLSPTEFDCKEAEVSVRIPFLLEKEKAKENSPATTPVFERPNQPPAML